MQTPVSITTNVERITPEIAASYLEKNTRNRRLNSAQVDLFVRDMKEGRWHETGQGISFYSTGELADGQTRLTAILKSGCPQNMSVTRGVAIEAAKNIDQGRVRSIADSFACELGERDRVYSGRVVSMCRELFTVKKLSPSEFQEVIGYFKTEIDFVLNVKGMGYARAFVMASMLLARVNLGKGSEERLEFFADIVTGRISTGLTEGETAAVKFR